MGKRGEITVFLSMILLCTAGLICVMLESARTAGARCLLQTAANSSMDSLFSQYHRALWQNFHVMGLEYRTEEDVEQRCMEFLVKNIDVENWYPMEADAVTVEVLQSLTDDGGLWLEEEIMAYMKFGIWDKLDILPEEGEELWKGITEAGAMQELSDSYKTESKEAWGLEKALNKIYDCLTAQREYHRKAAKALAVESGSGFSRQAGLLKKENQKIPKLVQAYEKQADKLKGRLTQMEGELAGKAGSLSDRQREAMEQELEPYRAYIEEDGERRQEILSLIPEGEIQLQEIKEVEKQVDDIEDYLSTLDEEDDDNSGPMWSAAEADWSRIPISGMAAAGVKDEEKRGWLKRIEDMVDGNLLDLVVPEGHVVSTVSLPLSEAPSKEQERPGQTDKGNLLKRVLVDEYCAMHFGNFLTGQPDAGEHDGARPQYEMEYILSGQTSDRKNLADTVKKILAVREGMNFIHILSDPSKQEEARGLALLITGALGLTPLVQITAFFIMSVWALGESIVDVQALLSGEKIPLLKGKEDWTLGLEQLLEMGRERISPASKGREQGMDYEGYLKLLLLVESSGKKYYRMMDVMQMKIRQEQPGFLMKRCGYRVDMEARVCGKHVFFGLPFVENLTGSREHGYQMKVRAQKAY